MGKTQFLRGLFFANGAVLFASLSFFMSFSMHVMDVDI